MYPTGGMGAAPRGSRRPPQPRLVRRRGAGMGFLPIAAAVTTVASNTGTISKIGGAITSLFKGGASRPANALTAAQIDFLRSSVPQSALQPIIDHWEDDNRSRSRPAPFYSASGGAIADWLNGGSDYVHSSARGQANQALAYQLLAEYGAGAGSAPLTYAQPGLVQDVVSAAASAAANRAAERVAQTEIVQDAQGRIIEYKTRSFMEQYTPFLFAGAVGLLAMSALGGRRRRS